MTSPTSARHLNATVWSRVAGFLALERNVVAVSIAMLLLAFGENLWKRFDVFLVIYATTIVGISAPRYGVLIAVQMVTAIVVYIPAGRIADRMGRKPFVIATFVAFSLFPLMVVLAHNFTTLVIAFVVGGLREIEELLRAREPLYRACADCIVETTNRSPEEVADQIWSLVVSPTAND